MNSGIYIHIPFCIKKCDYCDFYSISDLAAKSRYVDALIKHIKKSQDTFVSCDSVYFGGGTPSLIETSDFLKIINALKKAFIILPNCEITTELNPGTINREKLGGYRDTGINRISIGVQSANDNELAPLGRLHNFETAKNAILMAKDCGFNNISCDIMYGIPNQTKKSLVNTLEKITSFDITHISAYGLKIEQSTPFYGRNLNLPGEEIEREMYFTIVDYLQSRGFYQYEISNFAKPGFECRHNLKYWNCENYLSFGPCAASYFKGRRYTYTRDLTGYMDAVENGNEPPYSEEYTVSQTEKSEETIMLNLRLSSGFNLKNHGYNVETLLKNKKIIRLEDEEFLNIKDGIVSLTPKGFYISNAIITEIICTLMP